MARRREIISIALLSALLASACPSACAQDAGATQRRNGAATPQQQQQQSGQQQQQQNGDDEPLKRLDPSTLAGGDYGGTEPDNLAGGDYGRDQQSNQVDTAAPGPSIITDPLAAAPTGRRKLLPRAQATTTQDDDAYAPPGVRAGAFTLRPTIEGAGGYDDNPYRTDKGGKGSRFYRLRGSVDAQSDWSRHEVDVHVDGQIKKFIDEDQAGYEPNLNAQVDGRLDVSEHTKLTGELRSAITTSKRGDPDTPTNLKGDEIERSVGATLGASQTFNRFTLKLEGLADRYLFDKSKLQNGETLSNKDRIYNAYEMRLRGSYELSPKLQPFAEIAVDTRDYDKKYDDNGRKLGSDGYALRTGAQFEISGLVTGEAAVGYGKQTPVDKSLDAVDGLLFDGALEWRPTGLTTVRLNAKTAFQETTLVGAGGVLDRTFGVEVEHRLRRNLILTARADFDRSKYKGIGRIDDSVTLALEGEYRLNRTVSLFGSFQHEKLKSSEQGENYVASIVEFGLRMRR